MNPLQHDENEEVMTEKLTLIDIRCCVFHYLNCCKSVTAFNYNPLRFMHTSKSMARTHMSLILKVLEQNTHSQMINLDEESHNSDKGKSVSDVEKETLINDHFEKIVLGEKSNLLTNSQIDWIQRDRSQIYILMEEIEKKLIEGSLELSINNRKKNKQNQIQSTTNYMLLDGDRIISLSNIKDLQSRIHLTGSNLIYLSSLSTPEIYLNLLLLLDNIYYSTNQANRNSYIISLKEKYLKTLGKAKPIHDLISKHKIPVEWTYRYLLKQSPHLITDKRIEPHVPDKHHLNSLIFQLASTLDGDTKELAKKISKAWSVKCTRKKPKTKRKSISINLEDYDMLQEISKDTSTTQELILKKLINNEFERIKPYGLS